METHFRVFRLQIIAAVLFAAFLGISSTQFKRCDKKSSCADGTSEFSPSRNCQCDAQCSKFGDCCRDSDYYQSSPLSDCVEAGNWNIMSDYKDTYYMVKTCPDSWLDQTTQTKCDNYLETIREDPILGHPLTSKATNITYANYHCARCNNDLHISTMIRWKLDVLCGRNTELPIPHINSVLKNSTIQDGGWIKPTFNSIYHSCKLYVKRPLSLLRRCHKKVITFCPNSWTNDTVRTLCESYTSFVFYLGSVPYRNPHCAACNKIAGKFLSCEKQEAVPEYAVGSSNSKNETEVSNERTCVNVDEEYDPKTKKCRHVILFISGQDETNESCHSNITLHGSEYEINNDFTTTDLVSGRKYKRGEFRINEEGNVQICSESKYYNWSLGKLGLTKLYMAITALGISVIGLLLATVVV